MVTAVLAACSPPAPPATSLPLQLSLGPSDAACPQGRWQVHAMDAVTTAPSPTADNGATAAATPSGAARTQGERGQAGQGTLALSVCPPKPDVAHLLLRRMAPNEDSPCRDGLWLDLLGESSPAGGVQALARGAWCPTQPPFALSRSGLDFATLLGMRPAQAAAPVWQAETGARHVLDWVARIEAQATDDTCEGGSVSLSGGKDDNRNARLDRDEVLQTHVVCRGAPASGERGVRLPHPARLGQEIRFSQGAATGWHIQQRPGQRINLDASNTGNPAESPWRRTWGRISPTTGWTAVALSGDGRHVLAGGQGRLALSDAGGTRWQDITPAPGQHWHRVALSPDGQAALAMAAAGPVYATNDRGAHWHPLTPPGQHAQGHDRPALGQRRSGAQTDWGVMAASADLQTLLLATADQALWASRDGGRSWQRTGERAGWTLLAVSADGQTWMAGAPGPGLLRASAPPPGTDAAQAAWQSVASVQSAPAALALSANGEQWLLATGGPDATIHRSAGVGLPTEGPIAQALARTGITGLSLDARGEHWALSTADGRLWTGDGAGPQTTPSTLAVPVATLASSREGLALVAVGTDGHIYQAARISTTGIGGGLTVDGTPNLALRHQGGGVWSLRAGPDQAAGVRLY
jgi:hypothetical protein